MFAGEKGRVVKVYIQYPKHYSYDSVLSPSPFIPLPLGKGKGEVHLSKRGKAPLKLPNISISQLYAFLATYCHYCPDLLIRGNEADIKVFKFFSLIIYKYI